MAKTKLVQKPKVKVGTLEGEFWVWPDGRKTAIRFLTRAVQRYRPLPVGFYEAAEKANRPNLNRLVMKAKYLKLECTVKVP